MVQSRLTTLLERLASNHIPEGVHEQLHINSRQAWIDLVSGMIETGALMKSPEVLVMCVKNWEAMLTTRLSILN